MTRMQALHFLPQSSCSQSCFCLCHGLRQWHDAARHTVSLCFAHHMCTSAKQTFPMHLILSMPTFCTPLRTLIIASLLPCLLPHSVFAMAPNCYLTELFSTLQPCCHSQSSCLRASTPCRPLKRPWRQPALQQMLWA